MKRSQPLTKVRSEVGPPNGPRSVDASTVTLTIGELAEHSGVTPEAIRYYEREGVIPPAVRAGAGLYRRYGAEDSRRLRFIRRARDLGFSLAETRELLNLAEGNPAQSCGRVNIVAREQLSSVENKIAQLQGLRIELERIIGECEGVVPVGECRILSALNEPQL